MRHSTKATVVGLLVVASAALAGKGPKHKGKLVLDRGSARRAKVSWVTSRAIKGEDPDVNPLAELIHPVGIAVGPGDSIYEADKGGHRIVVYDPDGRPLRDC